MNQVQKALTAKVGPLPGWAWAGIVGVGAWLLLPHLRGSKGAHSSASAGSSGSSEQTYGLGYAQGLGQGWTMGPGGSPGGSGSAGSGSSGSGSSPTPTPTPTPPKPTPAPAPPPPAAPPPPPPPPPAAPSDPYANGRKAVVAAGATWYDWRSGRLLEAKFQPAPQGMTVTLGQRNGSIIQINGGDWGIQQAFLQPTGQGGAKPSRGSRSAHRMSAHHPTMKLQPRRPHWVRASGGPTNHVAEVNRVADQTGLHPARVLALNPHYTGFIRVA